MGSIFGHPWHGSDTAVPGNGGRPKVSTDKSEVVLAKKLHTDRGLEIDDICKTLRISRSTFYRCAML